MKSNLQNLVVFSAILLLTACGGGSGGTVDEVPVSPGNPTVTIAGAAVKGPILGGTITVTDANGAAVAISSGDTTDITDGSYSISISATSTIATPVTVTVTGGSAICDRPAGCSLTVAFGDIYALDADFSMSSVVRMLPAQATAHSGNISLASALATKLALGSGVTLTDSAVVTSQNQVKGLIKALTGIDVGEGDLNDIALVDITDTTATGSASLTSLAMSAFSAAALDLVDSTDPDNDTLGKAVANMALAISSGVDVTTGNVSLKASTIAVLARSLQASLGTVVSNLDTAGVDARYDGLRAAAELATQAAVLSEAAAAADPDADITVSPPAVDETTAIAQTRAFVDTLSRVINTTLTVTGAEGVGTDGDGATELLSDELEMVRLMSSAEATMAFDQMMHAICMATNGDDYCETDNRTIEAGATITDSDAAEDGVTFTATNSDTNVLTVSDVTSTAGSAEGVQVTLTVGTITHDINGGMTSMSDVVMVTSAEGTTVQTFMGDVAATFDDTTDGLGLSSLTLNGDLAGAMADAPSFSVAIMFSEMTGITNDWFATSGVTGMYTATLGFSSASDTLSLNFNGTIGSNVQSYAIVANDDMVMGSVTRTIGADRSVTDVDTMTDGTAVLSLTVTGWLEPLGPDHDSTTQTVMGTQVQFPGTLSVSGETTGTLDENGIVEYTDGSVQLIPGRVFNGSGAGGT